MLKYSPFFDDALFRKHMRDWRKQHRLSLRKMASITGYSHASLSRLENGEQQPDIGFFLALCYIMSLDIWTYFKPSESVEDWHNEFAPRF